MECVVETVPVVRRDSLATERGAPDDGEDQSPPLDTSMDILGDDACHARLARYLARRARVTVISRLRRACLEFYPPALSAEQTMHKREQSRE